MTALTSDSALPLVIAGQAAFTALLLATDRDGSGQANRLLALLFAIFALNMGKITLYASGAINNVPHLARITFPLEFLYGPLFFSFVRVTVGYRLTHRDVVHALPALVVLCLELPFFLESADAKRAILQASATDRTAADWLGWLGNWGTLTAYLVATVRTLGAHRARLRGQLSSIGAEDLRWLQLLTRAMIAAQVVEVGFVILSGVLHLPSGSSFLNTLALLMVSCTVGALALRQPALRFRDPDRATETAAIAGAPPTADEIAEAFEVDAGRTEVIGVRSRALLNRPAPDAETKYARSGLTAADVTRIAEQLESTMTSRRLWRDSSLSLTALARHLGLPSHHVSRALNEVLQRSFFDYVNGYRVRDAQRLLADPALASRSILELAFESGFNSKSSFNAAFRQLTGATPRAFRSAATANRDVSRSETATSGS